MSSCYYFFLLCVLILLHTAIYRHHDVVGNMEGAFSALLRASICVSSFCYTLCHIYNMCLHTTDTAACRHRDMIGNMEGAISALLRASIDCEPDVQIQSTHALSLVIREHKRNCDALAAYEGAYADVCPMYAHLCAVACDTRAQAQLPRWRVPLTCGST